jgi:DNA repair photolyase
LRQIAARTLLGSVRQPDDWFGLRYNLNLYRGCQHQCIYCDSRSECYRIEDFSEVLVKANAIELLRRELASKRVRGTIGTGSMNDPYQPLEAEVGLARRALEVIAEFRFPVHILTKSALVLRDLELIRHIGRVYSAVSFTITTPHDELGRKLEPGAALPSERFRAMRALADAGVLTGVLLMPVLPFIEDEPKDVELLVRRAAESGARYVVASFGMTMRDRQRAYYYEQLDRLFPGLREKYERRFGERYSCPCRGARGLERRSRELCAELGMATRIPRYAVPAGPGPGLFDEA